MKHRFPLMVLAAALALFLALLSPLPSSAQSPAPGFHLSGLVSLLSTARFDARFEPFFSLRFIPEVKFSLSAGRGVTVDA
ncbi:MAG: hypothetical protein MUQ25_00035, partial [Candidatus Aminicenantes bacterium]|nr:hypothetical protein [Candidatus Aminicenantes bacterium]